MDISGLAGKKFAASYSGGKDSVFAIYRAIKVGLNPAQLITTYNTDARRSWFHGISESMLDKARTALAIPLTLVRTTGAEYEKSFSGALTAAKSMGAEVCVFGDIDIDGHLEWCTRRCEETGLIPFFPLWKENRKKLVYEFIDAGFTSVITCVDTERLPAEFLGRTLNREVADAIERNGADICGENGEYHTFVVGGPIFTSGIDFTAGKKVERGKFVVLDIS